MVFSSILFLFLYLPIFLMVYFLIRKELRNGFLLLASLFFYFWGENWFVLVMIGSSLIDYGCGLVISKGFRSPNAQIPILLKNGERSFVQKAALFTSISANLSILLFFKYFNFGVDNYNALLGFSGMESFQWVDAVQITLPLGISFYTFQSMSYTIDVYLGNARATRHPINFASFVTMFPQLVAGPIVRYKDIAGQLISRTVTKDKFLYGVRRFSIGLAKKVIVANTVAWAADQIFAIPAGQLTAGLSWLGIVCYTLQIYFDFSGYSDMAIGLGHMLGFRFLENFNYPYIAKSIQDFWRRWHISLSSWFRDYLYIPLGGSRVSKKRAYMNLVIVFFLCGLWHGAAWNFVVWGLFHGAFLVIERLGFSKLINSLWTPFQHGYVLLIAMISWVLFRSDTLSYALTYLKSMFGFGDGDGLEYHTSMYLNNKLIYVLLIGLVGAIPCMPFAIKAYHSFKKKADGMNYLLLELFKSSSEIIAITVLLFASALLLSSGTHNPFIYFRF